MSKKSYRSRYRSGRTKAQMDNLPSWIEKSPSSALWNLLNPPNILIDDAAAFIEDTRHNMVPATFNPGERNPIYASLTQVVNPSANYSSESGNIAITLTDNIEDFFYGIPTRIVGDTGDAQTIPNLTRVPLDVHYMEDLQLADTTDDAVHESGGSIVVLQENAFTDSDALTFFTPGWEPITSSEVDRQTQDYENQPSDEWIEFGGSGNVIYRLNHLPVKDTVVVKNVFGLDEWGNAQPIPTAFTESGQYIVFEEDIAGSGMQIVEYDFIPHKTLRSIGPINYRGLVGVQGRNRTFTSAIAQVTEDDITLSPDISLHLDDSVNHSIVRTTRTVRATISALGINNGRFYLKFEPDQLRPGMTVLLDYTNEYGIHSQHELQATQISTDYTLYRGVPTYFTGVDVTDLLPSSKSTFRLNHFSAERYADHSSIVGAMESHVYNQGADLLTPRYVLDRIGQYIEEQSPESGGFVRRNLIGHTYITSDLPDVRTTHPSIQTRLFNEGRLLDPSLPESVPIALRRWASWIILLRKTPAAITPSSRFFEPTNLGESPTYDLVFIDIDTFEEYATLDLVLNFEPTSFTIGPDEVIHIIGYTGSAMADASTPHTIDIDSSLIITTPAETVHQHDLVDFAIDIPTPTADVHVKHLPSDTLIYDQSNVDAGEFTATGWGRYQISGEYNSTLFNGTFEVEPTTNRKFMRQEFQFRYDYAIRVPVDDEQETVYFRERYRWGIDKETTDA